MGRGPDSGENGQEAMLGEVEAELGSASDEGATLVVHLLLQVERGHPDGEVLLLAENELGTSLANEHRFPVERDADAGMDLRPDDICVRNGEIQTEDTRHAVNVRRQHEGGADVEPDLLAHLDDERVVLVHPALQNGDPLVVLVQPCVVHGILTLTDIRPVLEGGDVRLSGVHAPLQVGDPLLELPELQENLVPERLQVVLARQVLERQSDLALHPASSDAGTGLGLLVRVATGPVGLATPVRGTVPTVDDELPDAGVRLAEQDFVGLCLVLGGQRGGRVVRPILDHGRPLGRSRVDENEGSDDHDGNDELLHFVLRSRASRERELRAVGFFIFYLPFIF